MKFLIVCLAFAIAAVSGDVSHLFDGTNVERSYLPPSAHEEPSNIYFPPGQGGSSAGPSAPRFNEPQQQYQSAPASQQQYQQAPAPQQHYQPAPQSFGPPPPQFSPAPQQQYQPAPQSFGPPPPQFSPAPQQQYQPAPQSFSPPPPQFSPAPQQQYQSAPAPQQYQQSGPAPQQAFDSVNGYDYKVPGRQFRK